ncbi:MAG: HEPN domain-containing protein [bacterium]
MPIDKEELGSPQDWLTRARSNLIFGQVAKPEGVLWEELCFQLQQCVEKSIKAVLVQNEVVFPFIHNLSKLITLMKEDGIPWPDELDEAAELTVYAVETRYPGDIQPVTEEEHQQVLKIAERVYAWAEAIIAQPHPSPTAQ